MLQSQGNRKLSISCHRGLKNVGFKKKKKNSFYFTFFVLFYVINLENIVLLDGQLLRTVPDTTNIEPFVHEIEKHDYLMEDSAAGEQLRK